MNRRGFLGGLLAAPAIVRAESLMKLWVPPKEVLTFQGRITDFRFTGAPRYGRQLAKSRYFAMNYGVQDEGSRILLPAAVEQMLEVHINDNLLYANFLAGALTIENE